MVGRLLSLWDSILSGAMWVSGTVYIQPKMSGYNWYTQFLILGDALTPKKFSENIRIFDHLQASWSDMPASRQVFRNTKHHEFSPYECHIYIYIRIWHMSSYIGILPQQENISSPPGTSVFRSLSRTPTFWNTSIFRVMFSNTPPQKKRT